MENEIPEISMSTLEGWIPVLTDVGIQAAIAVAIFVVGRWLASFATKMLKRTMGSAGVDVTLSNFLGNLVYYVLLAAVLIATINQLGVETTSLLAVLGPRSPTGTPLWLPPATQQNARANVFKWLKRMMREGIDMSHVELVIDRDASSGWCGKPTGLSPCLTRSRGQRLWLLS